MEKKLLSLFLLILSLSSCIQKKQFDMSFQKQKENVLDSIRYYSSLRDKYIQKTVNETDEEDIQMYRDSSIIFFNKNFAFEKKLEAINSSIDSLNNLK